MICITPNGVIFLVSPAYDGKTSDDYVVRDSGFLKTEMQLNYLPIAVGIIKTCCTLNNLKKPLKT